MILTNFKNNLKPVHIKIYIKLTRYLINNIGKKNNNYNMIILLKQLHNNLIDHILLKIINKLDRLIQELNIIKKMLNTKKKIYIIIIHEHK